MKSFSSEDGRVNVVEANGVDGVEQTQVVLVGAVVAVPSNHVVGRAGHLEGEHLVLELVHHLEGSVEVFKPCHWVLEVSRVGLAIGADGAEVRQLKVPLEDLHHVAPATPRTHPCRCCLSACIQVDGKLDTTGNLLAQQPASPSPS